MDRLPVPDEPVELRARFRRLLEESPEEGLGLVREGTWISAPLWREWGESLERAGVSYEQFTQIAAGYGDELRLWVMGERPWEHCAAGLAGRVRRRVPAAREHLHTPAARS